MTFFARRICSRRIMRFAYGFVDNAGRVDIFNASRSIGNPRAFRFGANNAHAYVVRPLNACIRPPYRRFRPARTRTANGYAYVFVLKYISRPNTRLSDRFANRWPVPVEVPIATNHSLACTYRDRLRSHSNFSIQR